MKRNKYIAILFSCLILAGLLVAQQSATFATSANTAAAAPEEPSADTLAVRVRQLKQESYEDVTQAPPVFDLRTPDNITTGVEYQPETGYYIVHTRVGDMDIATPFAMTESEYRNYSERQAMQQYWRKKNSTGERSNEAKFNITDMKFDIGPADKIFGPGGVQVKTQGSAELLFGFKHNYVENPALTERNRRNNIFDFDEKIQLNVNGKVGDKIDFNMNYNTESSFDFDQQNIKLNYKGKEDDIIKNIEAGNVSLSLNSSLISGSQSLFGVKTELQFGRLNVQAIATQQNSESQTVSSKGGAQTTSFDINIDEYDENRHFFLAHYFRDNYEAAMSRLPVSASGVTINRVEVWVTNKRANYDNARNILAFMDLGETTQIDNNYWAAIGTNRLPHNNANTLYGEVTQLSGIRNIQVANNLLAANFGAFNINGGEDYEKIESARLLSNSEYTLNSNLGYISLRSTLNPDEVLAVAFEYSYGGQVYQVGEFSTDNSENLKAPNALMLKLLKSTSNSPGVKSWDLMMKNVYSLGAMQMQQDKFELYVMYKNDSIGSELQYITEGNIRGRQLLKVMELDNLDARNNRNSDGKFDYIEGYTALSSSGRIIFPVLEPFGSHLRKMIGNDPIAQKYIYQELYDSTLVVAQEYAEKNKFRLRGKFKASSGTEIRLNAMNVPRGSVTVTAGATKLIENIDYTVDYTLGSVTILNQAILESGTNIDVKLENQSTFNIQRKSLFGTHLQYAFNKDFSVGGTIMHLSEKPLTTKVNTGSEPISNTIWGLNSNYKTDMQWLTNLIDKLPFTTATQPSTLTVNAEFAQLIPGHSNTISSAGLAYLDDFETTKTNIDIHYPHYWYLASTPYNGLGGMFPEAAKSNDIEYGKNRALLAWYNIESYLVNKDSRSIPQHLKTDLDALSDHRVRIVLEQEIFPNRESLSTDPSRLSLLNLSYYPKERGPYNLDADGINSNGELTNPEKRWGGIMRKLDATDFETSNIEYIEFWMMDPSLTNPTPGYQGGYLYFNLGDVSEDILKDGKKAFEHGLPTDGSNENTEKTVWGRVSRTQSTVTAFSSASGARQHQDVGLNGLSTEQEFLFDYNGTFIYQNYANAVRAKLSPTALARMEEDPFSPLNDPAGDNYQYFRGTHHDQARASVLERYKRFNGTEGNSPDANNSTESYSTNATSLPDMEDINNDNTLNEYEKYYQYRVAINPNQMQVGHNYITDKVTASVRLPNGNTEEVSWYQFKIPVREYQEKVGSIRNFKSIRFIRMFMTGFSEETHLRFATMDLVRGDWRSYTKELHALNNPPSTNGTLDVLAVNIEENSNKTPVNYVLPPGVTRQTDPGQTQLIQQNEQAMVLRVNNLAPGDARAVYKNTGYDMRNYKRIQMFVHAGKLPDVPEELNDYDLTCFIRIGSDMVNNYYEYEIPLKLTPAGTYNNDRTADRQQVWIPENMFNMPLTVFTDLKLQRDKAKRIGTSGVNNNIPYSVYDEENGKAKNRITILGNPSLGEVETIMIGIRNAGNRSTSGEVWVNELRLSEFNEEGGVAAMASVALGLSDIGQVNVAGRLETSGYGSIESNVLDRRLDDLHQISVSAALEAGRLLPEKARLQIPLYFSYTNETLSPKYDPFNTDLLLKDVLEAAETREERDSIRSASQTVATSRSFNVSNAKVAIKSKKPQFYDPANFSFSYSISEQNEYNAEIEKNYTKDQRGSINYAHNFAPQPWEPFKNNKSVSKPAYKLIKEFNLYYLPQSWSFRTDMSRNFSQLTLRDYNSAASGQQMDLTFSKDFIWNRQFDIKYDLTRSLKFSLQTATNANIEESYFTPEIGKEHYEAWRDTVWSSIAKLGKPYTYQQVFTASWNVPINKIPVFDWVTANSSYNATYSWNRTTGSNDHNLGNVISSLATWQVDGQFNLEALYNKSNYLKSVNQRYSGRSNPPRRFQSRTYTQTVTGGAGEKITLNHRLGSDKLHVTAVTKEGRPVNIKHKSTGSSSMEISTKVPLDSVLITVVSLDPNLRTAAQKAADITSRFLMMVRRVSVSYRNSNSLILPGFYPETRFMGQQNIAGLYAPGYDFAFGFISDDFIDKAKENGWLSTDSAVVQPATRANTTDFDFRVNIEPLPGLKINLNGRRYTASNTSIIYSYDQLQENFTGSYNITQIALATAFHNIGNANNNYASETYNRFLAHRERLTDRLQAKYDQAHYPNRGFIKDLPLVTGSQYNANNGKVSNNSSDVLIPAFLAAYTGKDVEKISFNPFLSIAQILPNWSITYDGLSRLPWIKDHFRSVSLTHAYSCRYSIGSYTSYSTWVGLDDGTDKTLGFVRNVENGLPTPSSAYDIASISLTDQFSPLIGINVALLNSMTAKAEYKKQRSLALNLTSTQLIEGATEEFVVGVGYVIKDFDVILRLKSDRQQKIKNDLKLSADISYKDLKTLLRKIDENITQASSGNRVFGIKVMADYVLSSKLNIQFFFDHQGTTPLISSSFPVRSSNYGVNFKFMLTR